MARKLTPTPTPTIPRMKLWGTLKGGRPPADTKNEELARYLFGAENPPGCQYVAGTLPSPQNRRPAENISAGNKTKMRFEQVRRTPWA